MVRERMYVRTGYAPEPSGSYSQGVVSSGLLFVSGQGPIDVKTGEIPRTFSDQMRQALENVKQIVEAAGGSLRDTVRVGVYLQNLADFGEMERIYREYFAEPWPARTTVGVNLRDIAVEVDAVVSLIPSRP